MKIAAITDIGSCRQENQDNYCAQQFTDGSGWGLVCDGMGGAAGALAFRGGVYRARVAGGSGDDP